jgi:hypothetical protein
LVMMAEEASGLTERMASVHIWWCSILSIMRGPSMAVAKEGWMSVMREPSSPETMRMAAEATT